MYVTPFDRTVSCHTVISFLCVPKLANQCGIGKTASDLVIVALQEYGVLSRGINDFSRCLGWSVDMRRVSFETSGFHKILILAGWWTFSLESPVGLLRYIVENCFSLH